MPARQDPWPGEADTSQYRALRRSKSPNYPSPSRYEDPASRSHQPARSSSIVGRSSSHEIGRSRDSVRGMDDEISPAGRDRPLREERAQSPANGVPQFPFSSQLIRPLSAAPELLPTPPPRVTHVGTDDSVPSMIMNLASLPSADQIIGLVDHFGVHTNAAFPILHMPTIHKLALGIINGERIEPMQACILLCELQRLRWTCSCVR